MSDEVPGDGGAAGPAEDREPDAPADTSNAAPPVLALEHVSKSFGAVQAVIRYRYRRGIRG